MTAEPPEDEAVEGPDSTAEDVFGASLSTAVRYAELLADEGVAHGHLGPREAARLWSRHLLNCAVVTDLLPPDARVVDVGSGAGLPGLPMAIRRPDLQVVLVEPMQRRVVFLQRCVADLGLADRVTVLRGRAEDAGVVDSVGHVRWVTARAVAPLDRLVRWCLPLLEREGQLLALKGAQAQDEAQRYAAALRRAGAEVRGIAVVAASRVSASGVAASGVSASGGSVAEASTAPVAEVEAAGPPEVTRVVMVGRLRRSARRERD